jgi:hypothetical protein
MNSDRWEEMKAVAAEVIDHTARSLPAEIQEEARQVPVLFEEQCATDPDILGTYGHFSPNEVGEANGPITLYLVTSTNSVTILAGMKRTSRPEN